MKGFAVETTPAVLARLPKTVPQTLAFQAMKKMAPFPATRDKKKLSMSTCKFQVKRSHQSARLKVVAPPELAAPLTMLSWVLK